MVTVTKHLGELGRHAKAACGLLGVVLVTSGLTIALSVQSGAADLHQPRQWWFSISSVFYLLGIIGALHETCEVRRTLERLAAQEDGTLSESEGAESDAMGARSSIRLSIGIWLIGNLIAACCGVLHLPHAFMWVAIAATALELLGAEFLLSAISWELKDFNLDQRERMKARGIVLPKRWIDEPIRFPTC